MAEDEGEGVPTWIVTFADLMALLLCMFVLLLSFASMDINRYRSIADSMKEAFGVTLVSKLAGVIEKEGDIARKNIRSRTAKPIVQLELPPAEAQGPKDTEAEKIPKTLKKGPDKIIDAVEQLRKAIPDQKISDAISIEEQDGDIVLRFPDKTAFPPGTDGIAKSFLPTLRNLAEKIAGLEGQIIVSGHTDNVPINTARYRSNWDLSTARAVSVIHILVQHAGIDVSRVTAQGYADSRPLASNDTPEGRAKNRRIEIAIQVNKPIQN
ncbi:MAG: OmpA family protein [Rhodospirillaceae bacterium]|jgi:chemotaxis protein MotB|nr:OmpA family protein [Rhodospirillaceae bacterium]MBT4588119.1 OmpA family protein [Rhodospirillaceae bacterium]MBT4940093.1 OmpA family protein [Rhodospirillaceae bacterium]MBT5939342.1 OmpA family protein [Rhodospirillaceae bacterium]MBT7268466.1 OmpA family protein [Rhodospirillaceae bacterium]